MAEKYNIENALDLLDGAERPGRESVRVTFDIKNQEERASTFTQDVRKVFCQVNFSVRLIQAE